MIVSLHGALALRSLSIRRYRKRAFWMLFQRKALQAATCFHATCEAEYQDIRRAGLEQPVCVLPHGVDLPPLHATERGRRRLLFLGRVHPQKNVETLLRAWKTVQASFEEWDLEIVGRDAGNSFAALATRIGAERTFFRGPLYGRDKAIAFQQSDLFVLPSESENFGLAVAESLASATPVIVTRGTPWAAVESHGAGWWIESGAENLAATLRVALSRTRAELAAMGAGGREWMRKEFAWKDIGGQWAQTYQWLARPDLAPPPQWVRHG